MDIAERRSPQGRLGATFTQSRVIAARLHSSPSMVSVMVCQHFAWSV